jgi:AraC family transcriptional regulator
MNITKALNEAVEYIEENLDKDIDVKNVAMIAGCSTYHFTRMFSYLAGMSFYEYVRNRKLTKATYEIQHTDIKIIDLCFKYGYESPTSFSRAFCSLHGISPRDAKKKGVMLKSFLPITFQITIKGVAAMDYRIEDRKGFRAVGIKERFTTVDGQNLTGITRMWQEVLQNGMCEKITNMNNVEPAGVVGICTNMEGAEFDYYIASPTSMAVEEGMVEIDIAPATYAVFPCKMKDIQEVTRRIFSEWLPNSKYSHADASEIELYLDEENCEIMIPVIKS